MTKAQYDKLAGEVEDDVDADEKADPPKQTGCKIGTLSGDKKRICWGSPGAKDKVLRPQMRRVVKYKTAKRAAILMAGGIFTGGGMVVTQSPAVQFSLYCWGNRRKLYKRTCTKKWKHGKKKCRRFEYKRY